jgi:hypothetical protein
MIFFFSLSKLEILGFRREEMEGGRDSGSSLSWILSQR